MAATQTDPDICPTCNGSGWVTTTTGVTPSEPDKLRQCPACLGTGNRDQRGPKLPKPTD